MNLEIERNFSHPPARVFAYLTQTEHLVKWWGPENTQLGEHDLDLSRIGPWYFTLIDPAGNAHLVSGEVLAVDPPNFVEFTLVSPQPEGSTDIDSVVRFDIRSDNQGGSHFTLRQTGLSHEQMVKGSTQGWVSTLSRLEKLLQQIS